MRHRCIFTGLDYADAMHLFPRSTHPHLVRERNNIFYGVRWLHSWPPGFDVRADNTIRPVPERVWILRNLVLDEFKSAVYSQLERLEKIVGHIDEVRARDEEFLRSSISKKWATSLDRERQRSSISLSEKLRSGRDNDNDWASVADSIRTDA